MQRSAADCDFFPPSISFVHCDGADDYTKTTSQCRRRHVKYRTFTNLKTTIYKFKKLCGGPERGGPHRILLGDRAYANYYK